MKDPIMPVSVQNSNTNAAQAFNATATLAGIMADTSSSITISELSGLYVSGSTHRVYNFEVADHHTYIADGIRVHNDSIWGFIDWNSADPNSIVVSDDNRTATWSSPDGIVHARAETIAEEGGTKTIVERHYIFQRPDAETIEAKVEETIFTNAETNERFTSTRITDVNFKGQWVGEEVATLLTPALSFALFGNDLNPFEQVASDTILGSFTRAVGSILGGEFDSLSDYLAATVDSLERQQVSEAIVQATIDGLPAIIAEELTGATLNVISQLITAELLDGLNTGSINGRFAFSVTNALVTDLLEFPAKSILESSGFQTYIHANWEQKAIDILDGYVDGLATGNVLDGIGFGENAAINPLHIYTHIVLKDIFSLDTVEGNLAFAASFGLLSNATLAAHVFGAGTTLGGLAAAGSAAAGGASTGFAAIGLTPVFAVALTIGVIVDIIADKDPQAWTALEFDSDTNLFKLGETYEDDGGSVENSQALAQGYIDEMNTIIEAARSNVNNFDELGKWSFGHYEESISNLGKDGTTFPDMQQAYADAVLSDIASLDLGDGNLMVRKALQELDVYQQRVDHHLKLLVELLDSQEVYVDIIDIASGNERGPDAGPDTIQVRIEATSFREKLEYFARDGGRLLVKDAYGQGPDYNPAITISPFIADPYLSFEQERAIEALSESNVLKGLLENSNFQTFEEFVIAASIPEVTSSDIELLPSVMSAVELAQEYHNYLANKELADALIEANPDSQLAAAWSATIVAADDAGLNEPITAFGGSEDNIFAGGGGNDIIDSGEGDDTIDGEQGDDTLAGGNGDDSLDGGIGDDEIHGGNGDDTIDGGSGDEVIYGGADNDSIAGGSGNDTIYGNGGDDSITGDDGDDEIDGGFGNDTIDGGIGYDTIDGGAGDDSLIGGDDDDRLIGGADNDSITGDDGDDAIDAGSGSDTIDGGIGNDSLNGGTEDDFLIGGDADDNLVGGAGNDTITGDGGNDTIVGGEGNDSLLGGDGNDVLRSGAGQNTLEGGNGSDTYFVSEAAESVSLGWETDTGGENDRVVLLGLNPEDVAFERVLDGPEGAIDIIGAGTSIRVFNASNIEEYEFANGTVINIDVGGSGDDSLIGTDNIDVIFGGAGNDTIEGGAGNDSLDGGLGDDLIFGGTGDDWLEGWLGDDFLYGGPGDDILLGGYGNDFLSGGSGDDSLDGGQGDDTLDGGAGDDTLDGGEGRNELNGGADADLLIGRAGGTNLLNGGAGPDRIILSSGDFATGGSDADAFRLANKAGILDYNPYEGDYLENVSFPDWATFLEEIEHVTIANPGWNNPDSWGVLSTNSSGYESIDIWTFQDPGFTSAQGIILGGTFLKDIHPNDFAPGRLAYDAFNVARDTTTVMGSDRRDAFREGFVSFDNFEGTLGNKISSNTQIVIGGGGDDLFDIGNFNAELSGGEGSDYFILEGNGLATGDSGNDVFEARSGTSTLIGGLGNDDFIITTNFNGRISGGQGADDFHFVIDNEVFDIDTGDAVSLGTSYAFGSTYITDFDAAQDRITLEANGTTEILDLSGYDPSSAFTLETDSGYSLKNTGAGLTVTRGAIEDVTTLEYWQNTGARIYELTEDGGGKVFEKKSDGSVFDTMFIHGDSNAILHLPEIEIGQLRASPQRDVENSVIREIISIIRENNDIDGMYRDIYGVAEDVLISPDLLNDLRGTLENLTGFNIAYLLEAKATNSPIFSYMTAPSGDPTLGQVTPGYLVGVYAHDVLNAASTPNYANILSSWAYLLDGPPAYLAAPRSVPFDPTLMAASDGYRIQVDFFRGVPSLDFMGETGVVSVPVFGLDNIDGFLLGDGNFVSNISGVNPSGTTGDDVIVIDHTAQLLTPFFTVSGLEGNDYIEFFGETGVSQIHGDTGDDIISFGGDGLFGGPNNGVTVFGGSGHDTLILANLEWTDLYFGSPGNSGSIHSLLWQNEGIEHKISINGIERIQTADGVSFSDLILDTNAGSIEGLPSITFVGTDQADRIITDQQYFAPIYDGGLGDDSYEIDQWDVRKLITLAEAENGGYDSVTITNLTHTDSVGDANRFHLTNIENVNVLAEQDYKYNLNGGSTIDDGLNQFTSNTGNDTVFSYRNFDTINTGEGDDAIFVEGDGIQTVFADGGNDTISGGDGRAWLFGGSGDDVLSAGSNSYDNEYQILSGQSGSDTYLISKYDEFVLLTHTSDSENAGEVDRVVFTDLNFGDVSFESQDFSSSEGQERLYGKTLDIVWDSGHVRIANLGENIEEFEFANGDIFRAVNHWDFV